MPNMNNFDPKKWIVTFGKSIAYTTRDVVVDKLPNATSLLSEVGSAASTARDSVDTAISGFKNENGQITMQSIKNSSQYKSAMKVIDSAIADIKSGNITHAAELTDMDSFGDDLGLDFGLDEETSVDEDGNETATIAGVTNDAKVTAQATIRGAKAVTISIQEMTKEFAKIQRSVSKGSTHAIVQATIVSANMIHSDLAGVNKRLDIMNTNIASLVTLGQAQSRMNEQTTTHYARMEEAYTALLTIINDANGKNNKNDKSSAMEDLVKYGFNTSTFKELIKENIARVGVDSITSIVTNMFGMAKDSGMGLQDIFNLGMPIRSLIEHLLPKKTMAAIENFDRKIPRSMNLILSRLGDLSNQGGILGMVGQILGVNTRASNQIDMGKYNKGATAWSGTSKKALEEVIPHYLASIDEVLHKYLTKDESYEASYFDYDRGVFRNRSQIRSDFATKMRAKRAQLYYDSKSTLDAALKDQEGYYTVSETLLRALKRNLDAIATDAVENNRSTTETMSSLRKILSDPAYHLTPDAINDIAISYQSDIVKEKISAAKEMQRYMHSHAGSAFRQVQIGSQKSGHNKMYMLHNGTRISYDTTDLYGMFDFLDDKNMVKVYEDDKDIYRSIMYGDMFAESSYEKKSRLEAEERKKQAEEARKKTLNLINGFIQHADNGSSIKTLLSNIKTYYERASFVPPEFDAKVASIVNSASLAMDYAVMGDYTYSRDNGIIQGFKDLGKQIQKDFTKNYEYDKKIVRVIDFEMAIRKIKINGLLLNASMYEIHTKGSGNNPEFDYAKLYESNLYVGYPFLIKSTDIDPITQTIIPGNVKYVTESDFERQSAKDAIETGLGTVDRRRRKRENRKRRQEKRKQARIAAQEGKGWIGHGRFGSIVGRAEAAETNATKEKKPWWVRGPFESEFALRNENQSIFKEIQDVWFRIEDRLGGKEAVHRKAVGAAKGAAIGGILGGLGINLGPFFLPGGPIGGALIGAATGILASKIDFKKIMFGEKVVNENGEVIGIKKTGLIDQWGNTVRSALFDNFKSEAKSVGNELRAYWNKTMVPELEDLFRERSVRFVHATDVLFRAIGGVAKAIVNPFKFLNDSANRLAYTLLSMGVSVTGSVMKNAGKLAIQGVTSLPRVINAVRNYADYGFTRMTIQGTRNRIRGLAARTAYTLSPWEWLRGKDYSDFRRRFGSGVRTTDSGAVDNSDLDRKIRHKLAAWDRRSENKRLYREDETEWRRRRAAEYNRLFDATRGKRASRDYKNAQWEKRNAKIAGSEQSADARAETKARNQYQKLIGKYFKQDAGQFRQLDEATAHKRYDKLKKKVMAQPDQDIKDAFKKIDRNSPEDIENFILNPRAFVKMKKAEAASKAKETRTGNFMDNIQSALGGILNIMSGGKFTQEITSDKKVHVPKYGSGATDDGYYDEDAPEVNENDTDEDSGGFASRVGRFAGKAVKVAKGIRTGYRVAKFGFKTGKSIKQMWDNHKTAQMHNMEKNILLQNHPELKDNPKELDRQVQENFKNNTTGILYGNGKLIEKEDERIKFDSLYNLGFAQDILDYDELSADQLAARKGLIWDQKTKQYITRATAGQGWHGRKRARIVGHGIGNTLMNVGSKLIGGLKTAGSVAKTVGSKVWSGVKAGASAVSNFFGKNGESTVDSSGNIISYDASGNPVTSSTSQTKEATTKESNQSLSGSLKTGSSRSGDFSSAALDNSYKQNMLSGMNAALFLLSKGAYNPGFSLGKTGGSGNLQMDNVAKKEAQYEVAVGSAVSNLTEKAAAARTTNGKDANAPLVEGAAKQAVIASGASPNQQGNIFTTIANTIGSALPGIVTSVLPKLLPGLLAGGGLYTIISGILGMFGIGDGGPLGEALGLTDKDGNRTAYVDENGNLVDANAPGAQQQIIENSNLREKLLSHGTFDTVKWLGGKVVKTATGIGSTVLGAGKKVASFGKGVVDFVTGGKESEAVGNVVTGAKNKVASIAGAAKDKVVSTAGTLAGNAKTMLTNAGQKVAGIAGAAKDKVTGFVSNIANKVTGKATQVVDKGAELVTSSTMWQKVTTFFSDIITKLSENKLFKDAVGEGASAAINVLKEILGKLKGVGKEALDKSKAKISDLVEKLGAKSVGSIAKKAFFAVTAVWDTVSGALDAANLFRVHEEDVDFTMRAISVVLKLLSDLCPGADIFLTILQIGGELLGFDVSNWIATHMYNAIWSATHNGDVSGNKLAEHQAELQAELDAYNDRNGTNLGIDAYNDQVNKTFGSKVKDAFTGFIDNITGKNKETTGGQTHGGGGGRSGVRGSGNTTSDVGKGSFTKSSPVGHGRRRARIVGHGAMDQDGNVDSSSMKHQYTGLQDNGSTIQNGAYYFAQSDDRWRGETLSGFSSSIGKSGCVMTSAAMGASTLLNRSINPSVFNANYGNGNTSMGTRFGDLGLKVTRYPAGATQSSHHPYTEVADIVTTALRQRKPVMLYGTKTKDSIYWDGGNQSDAHCVLATAMDQNGNIIVNNPSGVNAQKNYGWKKTHPIESLQDVHWVQVMEKNDGSGISGILNTSGYTPSGSTGTSYSSYTSPATTGGANESASNDPFTSAWSAIASGLSSLSGTLLSSLFKNNSGKTANEEAPNAAGEDTVGHGRNYRQDDPSVANLPTGQGWRMKDGGCGVATIANMISGHGSDLLKSSYAASMNHFVDGGLTGDGMAATLSDMGYDPQSVTDTNTLNSLLARGVHVAALGAGHGSSAFPKNSPHWVDLQGYDPFTGKYTWMDPEKGLRTGNLDPSEISSAITIGHGAVGADRNESNAHMNVHSMSKKITAKIYTPTNLTASEFNDTIDKTARSYNRDPNGFLWNRGGSFLVEAEKKYGINGLGLLGMAQAESGLNSSDAAKRKNNATSIMSNGSLKPYGSPGENIVDTGRLIGDVYRNKYGKTNFYDIAPTYCPDIPSIGQYSSKWADNVTNYTTRFAAIAKGGDGSNTQNIETDKGMQNAGAFSITDSGDIPSATMSTSYSSSQSSSNSSDPFSSGWSSISSGLSSLGGTLLSNLFKNSGHGRRIVGHGGAKTGGVSASMLGTGGFVDDSIMGYASDDSLVTGNTNSGVTSRNNNTKIVGKMDIIISILRAMLKNSQASLTAQAGHGSNAARTSSSNNRNFKVGHGSNSNDGSLVRYRPTKTMRDRSIINRYGSTLNISNPKDRVSTDADYLRQVHSSISTGARKNLN